MRMIFGLVLVIGLGLAGFAVYMAQGYIDHYEARLQNERAARAKQVKLTKIYVAVADMTYGQQFTNENVKLVEWPEAHLPEGVFKDPTEMFPENSPQFRTVLRSMATNEPILASKVTKPGEDAGITSRLSKGMRAFAINVDVSSGVSGFLRPGDRVDVYWSGSHKGSGRFTKLIGAGVKLIAVDQSTDFDSLNPIIARTVTVEASPQEIAALAQAQSTGRLSLSLVGTGDNSQINTVEVNQNQLLGIVEEEKQEVVEEEKEKVCTIRRRVDGKITLDPIPCTN